MQYFLYLLLCSNFILCALAVELIEDGFDKPIFVTSFPSNNQSILVLEQKGIIRLIKNVLFLPRNRLQMLIKLPPFWENYSRTNPTTSLFDQILKIFVINHSVN